MKCSEIKDRLYLLADDELDKIERKKVLEHIIACQECHDEYNTILEIEKLICSSIQLEDLETMDLDIKKKNIPNRRHIFMKRKVITASIVLMILVGTFIPVNGQSLADNMHQWVKSLTFKTDKTDYTISTDLELQECILEDEDVDSVDKLREEMFHLMSQANSDTEKEKIRKEYETKINNIETEESQYLKVYSSIEDLPEDLGYNIQLPEYIPEGYTFSNVDHYTFDEGKTVNINLTYSHPEINSGVPSLYINHEFIKQDIPKREIRHSEGTKVKSVEINNYPAIYSYSESNEDSNTVFIDLNVFVDNGDHKMIGISMILESEKAELINMEKELMKIAQSILD